MYFGIVVMWYLERFVHAIICHEIYIDKKYHTSLYFQLYIILILIFKFNQKTKKQIHYMYMYIQIHVRLVH